MWEVEKGGFILLREKETDSLRSVKSLEILVTISWKLQNPWKQRDLWKLKKSLET